MVGGTQSKHIPSKAIIAHWERVEVLESEETLNLMFLTGWWNS